MNLKEYGIHDYRLDGDKTVEQAYKEKVLSKFYRRQIKRRSMDLTREECDKKYGTGEFFHLNSHSKFSILNGVDNPSDLFSEAKKCGMQGLAITETGYMSSIPDCYIASKDTDMKYIVGMSAHFSDYETLRQRVDKDDSDDIKNYPALTAACKPFRTPQITILAKNEEGYKELVNLNAESWEHGYYYIPRVTREMLKKYANGNLIIMTGSLLDKFIEFGYTASIENPELGALSVHGYLEWFHEHFGSDFYVESVMRCQDSVWGSDLDKLMTQSALIHKLKQEKGINIQTVITNDVRHISRQHENLYRAMMAINRNSTLNRITDYSSEQYFKTRSELRGTYHNCFYDRALTENEFEMACDRSLEVADKCNSFIADTSPKLPEIDNAISTLKRDTVMALKKRGLITDKAKYEVDGVMVTYSEQVKIELTRFIEKGFASYFIIMRDLVKHSHDAGWQTGPARGSAGGSLVCYLLGITSMDPIKFGLSFDRFLSPSRGGYMLKVKM